MSASLSGTRSGSAGLSSWKVYGDGSSKCRSDTSWSMSRTILKKEDGGEVSKEPMQHVRLRGCSSESRPPCRHQIHSAHCRILHRAHNMYF